jgi:hypothetical protein
MNASFEISPHKLAQNWQPKASSRQLEALKGLVATGAKTGVAKLAQKLAWQKKKLAILGTVASCWKRRLNPRHPGTISERQQNVGCACGFSGIRGGAGHPDAASRAGWRRVRSREADFTGGFRIDAF